MARLRPTLAILALTGVTALAGVAAAQPQRGARPAAAPQPPSAQAQPSQAPAAPTVLAGNADRGAEIYENRCTGCHSLDANRVGPAHRGVVGRRVGTARGFEYSDALRNANFTWTEPLIQRWLTNPEALIPGQQMGFRLGDPQERADVAAFLARESQRPPPAP